MGKLIAGCLSWFYRAGLWIWEAGYRAMPFRVKRVNARVISVGNITWGGTGKTPLTIKLAQDLSEYGKKVAVLTRGYGADEVEELRKKLPGIPVVVGRDRVKTAREAVGKYGAEILILDDGFQHLRLHRDLDIVNVNSVDPFGPGGLIPLGTLREPVSHLARAQVFILTKSNIGSKNLPWIRQKLQGLRPDALIFEAVHRPVQFDDPLRGRAIPPGDLKGRRVGTICAIGDPFTFEKTVENVGCEIAFAARFDDHHRFTRRELVRLTDECRAGGTKDIVTTQKDFFRMEPLVKSVAELKAFRFLILEIEMQVTDEEALYRRCLNS